MVCVIVYGMPVLVYGLAVLCMVCVIVYGIAVLVYGKYTRLWDSCTCLRDV